MSYQEFLVTFGHYRRPNLVQAYGVWHGDGVGPDDYLRAMEFYRRAVASDSLRLWCWYMWRAKRAWAAFLRTHQFPLPVAVVHS